MPNPPQVNFEPGEIDPLKDSPPPPPEQLFEEYVPPPAPTEAGQFGEQGPPIGAPVAQVQSSQFGAATPQGQFGAADPLEAPPGQFVGRPGVAPGGVSTQSWMPSGKPTSNLTADRALYMGVFAAILFGLAVLGFFTIATLIGAIIASISAILTGHAGLRAANRGAAGRGQAVAGLSTGYVILAGSIGFAVLVATFLATLFSFFDEEILEVPANAASFDSVSAAQVNAGDCMVDPLVTRQVLGTDNNPWQFQVVSCSEGHGSEVILMDRAPGLAYPGDTSAAAALFTRCEEQFRGYVNTDYWSSDLWMDSYFPPQSAWASGDTWVMCIVTHGSDETGSVQGSGR